MLIEKISLAQNSRGPDRDGNPGSRRARLHLAQFISLLTFLHRLVVGGCIVSNRNLAAIPHGMNAAPPVAGSRRSLT